MLCNGAVAVAFAAPGLSFIGISDVIIFIQKT